MEPDDMYVNDGTFMGGVPIEPVEQQIERKKERAKTLETANELKKIVAHFDNDIKATDSVQKALELAAKYDISKEHALIIMDIVRQQLEMKQHALKELLDIHTRNR